MKILRKSMQVLLLCTIPCTLLAQTAPSQLLLKDFRPSSIYETPASGERKHTSEIIDMHSHPYAQSREELDEWARLLKKLKISRTVILTAATGHRFDSLYDIYSKYGELFEVWCGFDYTGIGSPDWPASGLKELDRCYKKGARGIGELGDKGQGELYSYPKKGSGIHIDNPALIPLLSRCAELGMPINIHVAEPYWMYQPMDSTNDGLMNAYIWRVDTSAPGMLDHGELIQTLENAVRANPKTTFIACHFANCETNLSRISGLLTRYPNLYADIAARYGETCTIPRYMKKFYETHIDKLVYGTDMGLAESMYKTTFRILESADEHFYETTLFNYHWPCSGFDLSAKTLKKIYNTNASTILSRKK